MPESPTTPEPGRTPRLVAGWIVGLLLAAIAAHLWLLPPKTSADEAPAATPDPLTRWGGYGLTRVATTADANPLDGDRAMGYLRRLCEIGPRVSGTPGMAQQQKLLEEHFEPLADELQWQRFAAPHPRSRTRRVPMANLIARWRPTAPRRLLLCAHYDTRPLPDQDPSLTARRSGVFLGANDGASGSALLMELAHLMRERFDDEATAPDVGVDFVLFDGEELVWSRRDPYFLGSRYFGERYADRKPLPAAEGGRPQRWSYEAAVLLDMVGDADLQIAYEGYSFRASQSKPIAVEVWGVADRLGIDEFIPRVRHTVQDDHLALRKFGGIRAIDVIDFDYPHWHTTGDTPDKCSGESLAKVGWVMWEWLLQRAAE